jgi:hypothetical protein
MPNCTFTACDYGDNEYAFVRVCVRACANGHVLTKVHFIVKCYYNQVFNIVFTGLTISSLYVYARLNCQ